METLQQIFDKYSIATEAGHADKGTIHSYIPTYEKILAPYRDGSTIMEVGIAMGYSMKMWGEYFTNSKIIGADINQSFDKAPFSDPKYDIILHDATKPEFLDKVKEYTFDVVIDDGSHMYEDQKATFLMLKSKMKKGGIYIIEDIVGFDISRKLFPLLHDNCEIIDLRKVKNRFDDALIIYRF